MIITRVYITYIGRDYYIIIQFLQRDLLNINLKLEIIIRHSANIAKLRIRIFLN